jgi:hypothetical protein
MTSIGIEETKVHGGIAAKVREEKGRKKVVLLGPASNRMH